MSLFRRSPYPSCPHSIHSYAIMLYSLLTHPLNSRLPQSFFSLFFLAHPLSPFAKLSTVLPFLCHELLISYPPTLSIPTVFHSPFIFESSVLYFLHTHSFHSHSYSHLIPLCSFLYSLPSYPLHSHNPPLSFHFYVIHPFVCTHSASPFPVFLSPSIPMSSVCVVPYPPTLSSPVFHSPSIPVPSILCVFPSE